jgi:hypothetical protein
MKTLTVLRIPRPSGILLLNVAILAVLALVLNNRISHQHQAEIESAVRASHKLVKAVVDTRDLARSERLRHDSCAAQEATLANAQALTVLIGRFE